MKLCARGAVDPIPTDYMLQLTMTLCNHYLFVSRADKTWTRATSRSPLGGSPRYSPAGSSSNPSGKGSASNLVNLEGVTHIAVLVWRLDAQQPRFSCGTGNQYRPWLCL